MHSNGGALDSMYDDCTYYDSHPGDCGKYDDADFSANVMCCNCAGGTPSDRNYSIISVV